MFKVVQLLEFIGYVILYLFACYICYLFVNSACNFIYLNDWTWYSAFMFVFVPSCHTVRVNIHLLKSLPL